MTAGKALVLFDGVCNFCNGTVNFIISRDKKNIFRFTALQSEAGRRELARFEKESFQTNLDSIVLIYEGKFYESSTAIFKIIKLLGGWVSAFYPFIFLPKFFRDACYNLFAKYRYKLFGKMETCAIPAPEVRSKFID